MKKWFYIGLLCLGLFEIANVYFIMPMPGSQRMNSIDLAYFLYSYRWFFRVLFVLMILLGSKDVFTGKRWWIAIPCLLLVGAIVYMFNFKMVADHMFLQPHQLVLKSPDSSKVSPSRLIVGVEHNGEAKAYPIQYLSYHHQVRDTVGGLQVMVTYCNVCRTGRVFEPKVKGEYETFRLVGMDHFNAMFEDSRTKSWWRQENGEAVTGPLEGERLPEVVSQQMKLEKWIELHPNTLVMQQDEISIDKYDSLARFERGKSKSDLTRSDSLSWKEKSWVVAVVVNKESKVYDWNNLKTSRIINDNIGNTPIVIALASDTNSFVAYKRPSTKSFTISGDTLFSDSTAYNFSGKDFANVAPRLTPIHAYQEFWHSWQTFHPNSQVIK